jgi:hypothetical protein
MNNTAEVVKRSNLTDVKSGSSFMPGLRSDLERGFPCAEAATAVSVRTDVTEGEFA